MSLNLASTLKSDRHLQSHFSIGEERWQREQTTIPNALISLPNLYIDPEFNNLIPPLSHEEKSQLEANLKEFGCTAKIADRWKKRWSNYRTAKIADR